MIGVKYISYSGLSNKRTGASIYLQEKSCPVRPYSKVVNYDSPVRLFIFGKIPYPLRLFHTYIR